MITRRLKESGHLVRKTLTIRILNLKKKKAKLLSRTVLKSKMTLLSLETTEYRAPAAQLVEHRAVTREVVRSTPAGPTLRVLK